MSFVKRELRLVRWKSFKYGLSLLETDCQTIVREDIHRIIPAIHIFNYKSVSKVDIKTSRLVSTDYGYLFVTMMK